MILKGSCRYCNKSISWLYPFIELLTVILFLLLLLLVPLHYFFSYFVFFSALIVSIRTDLDQMLISRYVTLFLIPLGFILSWFELLPISLPQSIFGALAGYGLLKAIAHLFYRSTGKEGLGQGDMDLLAFIGSFTGIYGCWISLLLASIIGSLIGILYLALTKQSTQHTRIPFGPFLALGAMSFVLFKPWLLYIILGIGN
jgi:leader peptidase (prepilin peptidase)/N-methyltransferase